MDSLQIKSIRFFEAISSNSRPIADATHTIPQIKFIICEIECAGGIRGQGSLLSFHFNPNALKGALKDIASFIERGYRVNETQRLKDDYARDSEYFGQEGLLTWPLAIVNLAMWDALGKAHHQPVWKILGGKAKPVMVYGSGGWLSYSGQELIEEVTSYKKRNFQAMKIKVGSAEIERDVERISKVREAIGPDYGLMIDANQGMQAESARNLIENIQRHNVYWFEEPLDHKDLTGYGELKELTNILLAMGEREYDTLVMGMLAEKGTLDIWQPDIIRIGGVEKWRNSVFQAGRHGITAAPHFYKDYDIPLLCTIPNGFGAEWFDWMDDLIDKPLDVVDGFAQPRDTAGWGFAFQEAKMKELRL